jgi:transposase InsO family protein
MLIEKKKIKNRRKPRKTGKRGKRRGAHRGYYPVELKYKAVKLYLEEGYSSALIAEELGVCTDSVFQWVRKYERDGINGLKPKQPGSRRPKVSSAVKEKAVELKKANPEYGSRRISHMLKRMFCLGASPETVRRTLKEEDLVQPPKKKRKKNITRPRFFERSTPNQLWQTDIFTFRLGGRNAYLIGFIDDYSRFIVGMGLYRSQKAEQVIETFRRAAAEYRVPKEMLTDNGRQYTNWRGTTRFESELQKDRIKHIKSTPHHPMTLGKIERFWKTIFGEFLSRVQFDSFEEAQERLKLWIKYYNYRRPHQGIGGLCPADRFFEVQSEMKKVLSKGVDENILETALRGKPQKPFYMVGRWGDQSVVLHAEKGKVKMMLDGEEVSEDKELAYELEKEGKDNEHENNNSSESREKTPDGAEGVHSGREVPGSALDLDGASQALAGMQGDGCQLDGGEPVGEESALRYAQGTGTQTEEERGAGPGAGAEAGEAAGEDEPAGESCRQPGEAPRGDPQREEIKGDSPPPEGVIYLRGEQVPMVLELLEKMKTERSRGDEEGERTEEGEPVKTEGGAGDEGVVQTDNGDRGGPPTRSEPENLLQMGETRGGGDAQCPDGQGLRATLGPGGWREGGDQTDGYEDAEGSA